ncbi:MAG: hypothetical protein PHX43_05270 [Alphaproteobacteria bacterium]|nr:hypothetical protein [Alphaproteobacteria bacterium]
MKGLSLEQLRSELDSDAQRRCEVQAKAIKEQQEKIREQEATIKKLYDDLCHRAISEFCPMDNLCLRLMDLNASISIVGSSKDVFITVVSNNNSQSRRIVEHVINTTHFDVADDVIMQMLKEVRS